MFIFIEGKEGYLLWNKSCRIVFNVEIMVFYIFVFVVIFIVFLLVELFVGNFIVYFGDGVMCLVIFLSFVICLGVDCILVVGVCCKEFVDSLLCLEWFFDVDFFSDLKWLLFF